MEIVDAQVHVNRFMSGWQTAELDTDTVLDTAVAAMDAVGVDAVLIAEAWGQAAAGHGTVLPNGVARPDLRFSQRAVERFPGRFGYLASYDPRDPELARLISELRQKPGGLCLRVIPWPQTGELDLFKTGGFDPLFAAAEQYQVPVFVGMPGQAPLLEPYLQKFPKLWMILDHCGVGVTPLRGGQLSPQLQSWVTPTLEGRLKELEFIIAMARYPNLAIKWSNAQSRLSGEAYPHRDAVGHLRRVIAAFGAERVMWASDYTESRALHSWAQSLHYLLSSDLLSETEKEWVLGRSVRQMLDWPQPEDAHQARHVS
jgi:predicted TIM-barrel fold metal-dependent hydrolase